VTSRRRLVVCCSLLAAIMMLVARGGRELTPTEVAASTVLVLSTSTGSWGSGVVVGPDAILTAGHVVDDPPLIVRTMDGRRHAVVRVVAGKRDAALVYVDPNGPLPPPIGLSVKLLHPGEEVYGVGAPGSQDMAGAIMRGYVVNVGQVATYGSFVDSPDMVVTDMHVFGGVSGGPVIRGGRVVGMMVGMGGGYALVLPVTALQEFVACLNNR
jgi:S1-C subfamily serine protease